MFIYVNRVYNGKKTSEKYFKVGWIVFYVDLLFFGRENIMGVRAIFHVTFFFTFQTADFLRVTFCGYAQKNSIIRMKEASYYRIHVI